MDFLALLATILAAAAGPWALGRLFGPPSPVQLFQTSHDLGWPVGVQEEDLPPPFGSAVGEQRPQAGRAAPLVVETQPARAWRAAVGPVRMNAGTARR